MKNDTIDNHIARMLAAALLAAGPAACYETDGRVAEEASDTEAAQSDTGDSADGESGDADPTTGDVPADLPEGTAQIRVIHGAPDAPRVDIYAEGIDAPVIAGLSYGQTSDYVQVPEGEYNFQVRPAGASRLDTPVYETGPLALPDGASVSALAAGLLDAGNNDAFRVLPLIEGFDQARPGEALVRIVHAGSDAPAVDIDVGDDGTSEVEGLTRFRETGASGIALPAGQPLQVGIRVGDERVTAFTTPALLEGEELLVIATGLLGKLPREADGFSLLAVGSGGSIGFIRQNPVVYALHAGADAPEVDICAGDTPLASHLYYGQLSPAQVPPGEYSLDFFRAPSNCAGEAVASDTTPMLEPGERYLAIATGEINPAIDEPPLQLIAFREAFDVDNPAAAVFNLVHAASAPMVDVGLVTGNQIENGNVLWEDLKWPTQSSEFAVQPFTYQVGVAAAGASLPLDPIASFHIPATAGLRAFVVAAGDLSPESTEHTFQLLAVDTATTPWAVTALDPN